MLKEVSKLRKRKIRLTGVCEAQREMLLRDWKQVESRMHWLESSSSFLMRFKSSMWVAAPMAGILFSLVVRKKVRFAGIIERASEAWRLVDQLKSLYRGVNIARQMVRDDLPE
jgi:hypothetical protein